MDIKEIIKTYPTKKAFCDVAGISIQYLNQIENKLRPWPPKAVARLSRAHGIDPKELRPDFFEDFHVSNTQPVAEQIKHSTTEPAA